MIDLKVGDLVNLGERFFVGHDDCIVSADGVAVVTATQPFRALTSRGVGRLLFDPSYLEDTTP